MGQAHRAAGVASAFSAFPARILAATSSARRGRVLRVIVKVHCYSLFLLCGYASIILLPYRYYNS